MDKARELSDCVSRTAQMEPGTHMLRRSIRLLLIGWALGALAFLVLHGRYFLLDEPTTTAEDDRRLFWVDFFGSVHSSRPDGSDSRRLVTQSWFSFPDGIAIHPETGRMFWTNMGMSNGTIMSANADGSDLRTVVPTGHTTTPKQLALDPVGNKLYWGDRDDPKIMRANLDGSGIEIIIDGDLMSPVGLALDPVGRWIYFTDRYAENIKRSRLDGSGVEIVVGSTVYPTDIAVDPAGGHMYWASRTLGEIYRARLDGSHIETIVTGLNQPIGVTVDPAAGALYYTDPFLLLSSVYRAELDGSNPRRMLLGGTPLGIMYAAGRSGGAVAH